MHVLVGCVLWLLFFFMLRRPPRSTRGGSSAASEGNKSQVLIVEQNVPAGLSLAHRVVVMKTGQKIYDGDPAPMHDHVNLMTYF